MHKFPKPYNYVIRLRIHRICINDCNVIATARILNYVSSKMHNSKVRQNRAAESIETFVKLLFTSKNDNQKASEEANYHLNV